MSSPRERFWNNLTAISTLLILGAGFVALFAGFKYFFLIWILGFSVVVPIVAILTGEASDLEPFEHPSWNSWMESKTRDDSPQNGTLDEESTTDALTTLRERYANGDLTDEQFEQKLDRLLETETPEDATEWRERTMREVGTERSE